MKTSRWIFQAEAAAMTRPPNRHWLRRLVWPIRDEFRGDNTHLRACIKALIELSDENTLVPHGIGSHARALLAACYRRLLNAGTEPLPPEVGVADKTNL